MDTLIIHYPLIQMLQFDSISGQSIWDICLNTYGCLDYMAKLLQDNGIDNIDTILPVSKTWFWDETLSSDQALNQVQANANIIYATNATIAGNVLFIIKSNGQNQYNNPQIITPITPNSNNMYQKTSEAQYIATGGETMVTLTPLIGATITLIVREVQPLKTSEYSFDATTGTITLTGNAMNESETLYIIYNQMITS